MNDQRGARISPQIRRAGTSEYVRPARSAHPLVAARTGSLRIIPARTRSYRHAEFVCLFSLLATSDHSFNSTACSSAGSQRRSFSFLEMDFVSQEDENNEMNLMTEFTAYKGMNVGRGTDALDFWQQNHEVFPKLASG